MEQLADRSVYRCHLQQQTSGGQVLEEQSDDRKNNKYNLQTSQVSQSEKKKVNEFKTNCYNFLCIRSFLACRGDWLPQIPHKSVADEAIFEFLI